jgi:DNA-directed RNA polymerase specialized sigma24 family protein
MTDLVRQTSKKNLMREVSVQTKKIHKLQNDIVKTAETRRKAVLALRAEKVTYREIAEQINMSEVTVYKIIIGK